MSVYGSPLTVTVPRKSCMRATEDSVRRERHMRPLQEATKVLVGPSKKSDLRVLTVKTSALVSRKCVALLVS